jgi:hypothetical protein
MLFMSFFSHAPAAPQDLFIQTFSSQGDLKYFRRGRRGGIKFQLAASACFEVSISPHESCFNLDNNENKDHVGQS